MKSKKFLIICIALLLVAAIATAVIINDKNDNKSNEENEKNNPDPSSQLIDGDDAIIDNGGSNGGSGSGSKAINAFPIKIPDTQLEILNFTGYTGVFIEDGSDAEISGVSAIVLKNCGKTAVEFASVSMNCGERTLQFEGSDIPADGIAVIQEKNKTPFSNNKISCCEAIVAEVDELTMSKDTIKITENNNNTITVKNISDDTITCVRVFYKFYSNDEAAFVGGITYVSKLTDIEAGAEQIIAPSHYHNGYSRVVMVRTYDSYE